jgi:four helix bundle protein
MTATTQRDNANRGYLKLDVWNSGMELTRFVTSLLGQAGNGNPSDRLARQILDSAVAIPANIAEGYCRRNIGEYIYFLNVALGNLGGLMTRVITLRESAQIDQEAFDWFDQQHAKLETELMNLIRSLEAKRRDEGWDEDIREPREPYIH